MFHEAVDGMDPLWYHDDDERFVLTRDGIMVLNRILLALFMDL